MDLFCKDDVVAENEFIGEVRQRVSEFLLLSDDPRDIWRLSRCSSVSELLRLQRELMRKQAPAEAPDNAEWQG